MEMMSRVLESESENIIDPQGNCLCDDWHRDKNNTKNQVKIKSKLKCRK